MSRGDALHRKGVRNSRVLPPFPESPRCLRPIQGSLFSLHCLNFQAEDRLTPWWSVDSAVVKPRGKAWWESLVGKPLGKASRESHCSLDSREGKQDTAATAREESTRACPHSRRGLTPLVDSRSTPRSMSALERNPQVSGTHSRQDLRNRHRRERNPERPPSNSHGDWPFLTPPERVPKVPDVSGEHLRQLEKIQEVLPSRRDEAHFL